MKSTLVILLLFLSNLYLISSNLTETNATTSEDEEIAFDDGNEGSFTQEWVQKMRDYESTYVYMIPVAYKSSQIFYENITTVPARVRGAFILDEGSKDKIEFKIKSPKGLTVYSNVTNAALFDLNVTESGLYEVSFNNRYKNGELKPTFTMNTGQNEILKKKDLSHTEEKLDQLISFLKNFGTESRVTRSTHRRRAKKLMKTNRYFYTFSVIETIVLIAVSAWQFYYMKNLFEIKGSL